MRINTYFKYFVLILLITSYSMQVEAQCEYENMVKAEQSYAIGDFNKVKELMNACVNSGNKDTSKVEAYKLLAKTYLAEDNDSLAIMMVNNILNIIPDYSNFRVDDPEIFKKMIESLRDKTSKNIVVSVSKKSEVLEEAPATVMLITEEEIRRRGYTHLEAILSDLPGFDISRTFGATYSNFYQRGYRANNTERTIILVDGVEDNDLWSDFAYFSRQYPVSNIKQIEIIYGPASTMYGANAFLGVINIITKDNSELLKNKNLSVNAHLNYGSYNTRYADITTAAKVKNANILLTIRRYLSDEPDLSGYDEFDYDPGFYDSFDYLTKLRDTINVQQKIVTNNLVDGHPMYTLVQSGGVPVAIEPTAAGIAAAQNFDKQALQQTVNGHPVKYFNLADDWYINARAQMGNFTVGFNYWKTVSSGTTYFTDNYQAGGKNGSIWVPIHFNIYSNYDYALTKRLSVSNSIQFKIHKVDDTTGSVTFNNYSNGRLNILSLANNTPSSWATIYLSQTSKQFRNETKFTYIYNANFDIVAGFEIRNGLLQGNYNIGTTSHPSDSGYVGGSQAAQGAILGGNAYDNRNLGSYFQSSLKIIKPLKLITGIRYDYNKIRTYGGFGSVINPRAVLVYTQNRIIAKVIYSEAFKDASNWTKFTTNPQRALPSPELQPERVKNLEVSLAYLLPGKFYAEVVAYNSNYTGVIGTKTVPYNGGTTSQNFALGALKIQGIQAHTWLKFQNYSVYANFTFTNPQNNIIENEKLTNRYERVGDIAAINVNWGVNALYFKNLNINLRFNYVGERPTGKGTSVPLNTAEFPAHLLINLAITYDNLIRNYLTLQLVCNNLTNVAYYDPGIRNADGTVYTNRVPQYGRNFMIKTLINF